MVALLALLSAVFFGIFIASLVPHVLLATLKDLFRCKTSASSFGYCQEKRRQHHRFSPMIDDEKSEEIVAENAFSSSSSIVNEESNEIIAGQAFPSSYPISSLLHDGSKPDPYDPSKRQGYLSWDDYFMAIAFLSAHRSKDPNRQVGACLVSQDRVILGIGYNGFPRGCPDDELPWAKLSIDGNPLQTKYPYVCHAEVNAILNKNHASAHGQRLYVTMFPCNECAKIIIQAGVAEVVYFIDKNASSDSSYTASQKLLSLARVKVWQHRPVQERIILEFK